MDFGRITMADDLILYLFGTPGQTRFWFMWDELIRGAMGAAVLVDTRRIADSFAPLDYFENRHLPYLVAINCFDGAPQYEPDEVREALAISPHVPLVMCDARHRDSVKQVLVDVVEHAMLRLRGRAGPRLPDRRLSRSGRRDPLAWPRPGPHLPASASVGPEAVAALDHRLDHAGARAGRPGAGPPPSPPRARPRRAAAVAQQRRAGQHPPGRRGQRAQHRHRGRGQRPQLAVDHGRVPAQGQQVAATLR